MATTEASNMLTDEQKEQVKKDLKHMADIAAQKLKEKEAFYKRQEELIPKHMAEIKKLEEELKKEGDNLKKKEKLDNLRRATMGTEEEMLELIKLLA